MAHPGRGYILALPATEEPNTVLAMILQTLLDHEVSFCLEPKGDAGFSTMLTETTGSRLSSTDRADYIVITDGAGPDVIRKAKKGTLAFPDSNATLIFCVDDDLERPNVKLSGPGIPDASPCQPTLGGLTDGVYRALRAANAAFPLGLDCMVVTPTGRVMCIPRSSTIEMGGN